MTRTVFFISDGTGITAETLGRSLLSQFDMISFNYTTIPYVNNPVKAEQTLKRIKQAEKKDGERPIIFATIIDPEINRLFHQGPGLIMDFFQTFINPLEEELKHKSSHAIGRSHGVKNYKQYMSRINAVNYTLAHDDGINTREYTKANVILVGVSRCGKTPTCLYLALQSGIFAANYPLTDEDMQTLHIPDALKNHRDKLFGLIIEPSRLHKIRQERRPNSDYSSLKRCEKELAFAHTLFQKENIPYLDTTTRSIEEIAAEIMATIKIKKIT